MFILLSTVLFHFFKILLMIDRPFNGPRQIFEILTEIDQTGLTVTDNFGIGIPIRSDHGKHRCIAIQFRSKEALSAPFSREQQRIISHVSPTKYHLLYLQVQLA